MLKTIKKNVQMRLDELIKYVWDNDIENKIYRSDNGQIVKFLKDGRFESGWDFGSEDLFLVEIEEEITEDTEFESVVTVLRDKFGLPCISYNTNLTTSIKKTIENFEETNYKPLSVYALIGDELELIYKVEDNNREE